MKKFARKCSQCGKLFNQGFCVFDGEEYYCSNKCLFKNYNPIHWQEMYNNEEGYWTEWEDDFQYYEDGTEVEK